MVQIWWQCAYYAKETNPADSCITGIITVLLPYACCPVLCACISDCLLNSFLIDQ